MGVFKQCRKYYELVNCWTGEVRRVRVDASGNKERDRLLAAGWVWVNQWIFEERVRRACSSR